MKTSYAQKEKGDFELIKGEFAPDDALEILSNLIQKKISYHNLRSFSHYERLGVIDEWSASRIQELKKSLEAIQIMIGKAKEQGHSIGIQSSISIEIKPS